MTTGGIFRMKKGKRYAEAAKLVDRTKLYDVKEAVSVVKKAANAKFDETIEAHLRLGVDGRQADQQIRGAVVLPHGTGKKVRVLVFAKDAKAEEAKAAGKMGVSSHPKTRPAAAEAEAIGRLLRLAEVADVPVVVVHLTCKEGYDVIAQARKRGQKVYVETCPQYLLMDDSLYELPGFESAKYVCAPPLRKKEDQDCLWKGLADGTIQTVSTDHCSFTTEQKKLGEGDFTKIPGGMPGAETRGTLIYTYGVDKDRITKEDMCRVLSENPAKLYGLYPRKGVIAPGSDADLVIMRTGVEDVITAKDQVQNVDYAPFEGTKVTGRVVSVFLRGLQAVKDGKVVEEKKGEFLKRGKYAL